MNSPHSKKRLKIGCLARWRQGFSLVEMVLALGIVSFGLITVMGLIPAGLMAVRQSMVDTAVVRVSQTASSFVRNERNGDEIFYFDVNGNRTDALTKGGFVVKVTPETTESGSKSRVVFLEVFLETAYSLSDGQGNEGGKPIYIHRLTLFE